MKIIWLIVAVWEVILFAMFVLTGFTGTHNAADSISSSLYFAVASAIPFLIASALSRARENPGK